MYSTIKSVDTEALVAVIMFALLLLLLTKYWLKWRLIKLLQGHSFSSTSAHNVEWTYDTGVAGTEVSVSAAGAGVGSGGGAAVAGTSTFFQSAPGSTISAISSPTAISGQFSGFCTRNSNRTITCTIQQLTAVPYTHMQWVLLLLLKLFVTCKIPSRRPQMRFRCNFHVSCASCDITNFNMWSSAGWLQIGLTKCLEGNLREMSDEIFSIC